MRVTNSPLAKVALAFAALGVALLAAVGGLFHSAVSRLDEQRRMRHQMVADRVFDEAERELSTFLQHEAERPSAAYEPRETDPKNWFPFVVGYYRRDPNVQLIAEMQLEKGRQTRIRNAVLRVRSVLDDPNNSPNATAALEKAAAPHEITAQPTSPDVLRQLNRGIQVRERRLDLTQVFVVALADRNTLVIERDSPEEALSRREGFVLDVPSLISTIQGVVLSAQGLGSVASLHAEPGPKAKRTGAYAFEHRLAPPLESQKVLLRLSQLDDEDASSSLYGLAALLAAATVLGLLAIYWMVAVQVRFAERRNNFAAAVTHELKTPLTSIRMYGEMLRDGMVDDDATRQEYYAIITAEGERLTRLIENVLEHAKLRKGNRHAHLVKRDVVDVVREVVDVMAPHLEREGFETSFDATAGLPLVQLDVDAIKQVLFNVIDNAIKYGRAEGRSRLEVGCELADGGVLVSIRDHGAGVAEEHLETIFEPFFRGEHELTRRQKGTGIGLALVRDLVELMNGRVTGTNRAPGFEVRIALKA